MKTENIFRISILLFLILPFLLFAKTEINEPKAPAEPGYTDITIPEVSIQDQTNSSRENLLYQLKSTVILSEGRSIDGLIHLTNDFILTITNTNNNMISINTFSIFNIEKIDIVKWDPVRESNDNYLFTPVQYKIYTNQQDSNYFLYSGNISTLNAFDLSDDQSLYRLYSIFYDQWIEGKKGFFRWDNSKATTFSYNFTNPIPGVVKTIIIKKYY